MLETFPPFVLFDAPCELRCNFIGAHSRIGVHAKPRANDLHYGLVVNGFHPQLNARENPPQLVDGRYASRTGSARNEREQKRAQKITDLIETLRKSMIDDGWSVELGSKYVTLASCTTYIQHLRKSNTEKEDRNAKLKARVREHEKSHPTKTGDNKRTLKSKHKRPRPSPSPAPSEGPSSPRDYISPPSSMEDDSSPGSSSDEAPGSVNSSLTSASSSSGKGRRFERASMSSLSSRSGKGNKSKKARTADGGSSPGSNPEGSTDGGPSSSEGEQQVSFEDDVSPPSSDSGASEEAEDEKGSQSQSEVNTEREDQSVYQSSSEERPQTPQTLVEEKVMAPEAPPKKEKPPTLNSLDPEFVLDYGEVFDSSNVPQMIANFSGRIMAWNKYFNTATGFTDAEARKNTIFSLVRPDRLSNLFEIVARALRSGEPSASPFPSVAQSASPVFKTVTVPCVGFAGGCTPPLSEASPLYMTITFLGADEPRGRCFHCVFADRAPVEGGSFGRITTDLLGEMSKGCRRAL